MTDYDRIVRQENFAAAIDVDHGATPIPEIAEFVVAKVREHGIDHLDFWDLDERPGAIYVNGVSYTNPASHWHRNLRVTRNTSRDLFDAIKENAA